MPPLYRRMNDDLAVDKFSFYVFGQPGSEFLAAACLFFQGFLRFLDKQRRLWFLQNGFYGQ